MKRPSPREFLKFSTIQSNEDLLAYATALEKYCDYLENDFTPSFVVWAMNRYLLLDGYWHDTSSVPQEMYTTEQILSIYKKE